MFGVLGVFSRDAVNQGRLWIISSMNQLVVWFSNSQKLVEVFPKNLLIFTLCNVV